MDGHCGATRYGGSCQGGSSGAWPLLQTDDLKVASEECLRKCSRCARCRYISVSAEHKDCSWYASCDMSRLDRRTGGFVSFAANATIGSSVDYRNQVHQRRRRREARHRAAVNEAAESLLRGNVLDEEPRPRQWRHGILVLALGVLSLDSKREAARCWVGRSGPCRARDAHGHRATHTSGTPWRLRADLRMPFTCGFLHPGAARVHSTDLAPARPIWARVQVCHRHAQRPVSPACAGDGPRVLGEIVSRARAAQ